MHKNPATVLMIQPFIRKSKHKKCIKMQKIVHICIKVYKYPNFMHKKLKNGWTFLLIVI